MCTWRIDIKNLAIHKSAEPFSSQHNRQRGGFAVLSGTKPTVAGLISGWA